MIYKSNIPTPDNMSEFSDHSGFVEVSEEQEVQIFVKQMLLHRMFIGHYQERRYVDELQSYRDVIVVHETEDKLERDLEIVKKKLQLFYYNAAIWIGITGPNTIGAPSGVCVWVKLQNMAFGYYWFQIRRVKFIGNQEVILRLKCIKAVNSNIMSSGATISTKSSSSSVQSAEPKKEITVTPCAPLDEQDSPISYSSIIDTLKSIRPDLMTLSLMNNVSSVMTLHNTKEAASFAAVLVVACITGLVNLVGHLGDFTIRFMRELTNFLHVLMPFFIAIVDIFGKCVGGFYILIAMIWRGTPVTFPKQEPSRPMLQYRPIPPARAQYYQPQQVNRRY